jgi:hypothetical protein
MVLIHTKWFKKKKTEVRGVSKGQEVQTIQMAERDP